MPETEENVELEHEEGVDLTMVDPEPDELLKLDTEPLLKENSSEDNTEQTDQSIIEAISKMTNQPDWEEERKKFILEIEKLKSEIPAVKEKPKAKKKKTSKSASKTTKRRKVMEDEEDVLHRRMLLEDHPSLTQRRWALPEDPHVRRWGYPEETGITRRWAPDPRVAPPPFYPGPPPPFYDSRHMMFK